MNVTKLNKSFGCSICGDPITKHPISGWAGGHNAEPINSGRCCDFCNVTVVIPARLQQMSKRDG